MPEGEAARYRALRAEVQALRDEVRRQADDLDTFMSEVEAVVATLVAGQVRAPDVPEQPAPPRAEAPRPGLGRGLDALIPRREPNKRERGGRSGEDTRGPGMSE